MFSGCLLLLLRRLLERDRSNSAKVFGGLAYADDCASCASTSVEDLSFAEPLKYYSGLDGFERDFCLVDFSECGASDEHFVTPLFLSDT